MINATTHPHSYIFILSKYLKVHGFFLLSAEWLPIKTVKRLYVYTVVMVLPLDSALIFLQYSPSMRHHVTKPEQEDFF
jgi:hypothetical protein